MNPRVPIDWSLTYWWSYLQGEEPEVQLQIIANTLIRFLIEHVPEEDHAKCLQSILDGIPVSKILNMPTQGGVQ